MAENWTDKKRRLGKEALELQKTTGMKFTEALRQVIAKEEADSDD